MSTAHTPGHEFMFLTIIQTNKKEREREADRQTDRQTDYTFSNIYAMLG